MLAVAVDAVSIWAAVQHASRYALTLICDRQFALSFLRLTPSQLSFDASVRCLAVQR